MSHSLQLLLYSGICFLFFHCSFLNFASEIFDFAPISRLKTGILYIINYFLLILYSILELNLTINWTLLFLFYTISLFILAKKGIIPITVISIIASALGLSINIFFRCVFSIFMRIPPSSLNNDTLNSTNMKFYPIAFGFIFTALLLNYISKAELKKYLQIIFRTALETKILLILLLMMYIYQILTLFLFYTQGNYNSLKIFGTLSALFVFNSVFCITRFIGRFTEMNEYRQKNFLERENLLKEKAEEQQLLKEVGTDTLTGCKTRVFIEDKLHEAVAEKRPFIMAFADMNELKSINDNYGHKVGDQCIRAIGKTLIQATNPNRDMVGRYGGDEFLVLFFTTDKSYVTNQMTLINKTLKELSIVNSDTNINLSISYGLVLYNEGETPLSFLSWQMKECIK